MVNTVVTDIHCHVIPGVDDGAGNMKESMRMMEQAAAEGIRAVVATPHFNEQMDRTALEQYIRGWDQLHTLMQKKKISITLYPGNEIFYSENALRSLARGEAMGMNDTRYVLVEFAPYTDYRYMRMVIQQMQYEGYWPILAHMERYRCLEREERVQDMLSLGTCLQVNTGSVTGEMGWKVSRRLLRYIRKGWIHFLGTDAHGSEERTPRMADCLRYIEKKAGTECRVLISESNPEKMLRGEDIRGDYTD